MSQLLGYTGPVSAEQLPDLRPLGYLPDDLLGKTGLEAQYETELRGTYGAESVERDATGRKTQVLQTISEASPGSSLNLTIDTKEQKYAETALKWAMSRGRAQAWRRHRHEPPDRRGGRAGQPPDLRQQPVRARDQQCRLPGARRGPRQAAPEPRDPGALPTRLDIQARDGHRAASRTGRSPRAPSSRPRATSRSGRHGSTTGTGAGSVPATSTAGSATRATRTSSRSPGCSGSTGSGYWAKQYGFGQPHRDRPPRRGRPGSSRPTSGSRTRWANPSSRARPTRRASARAMTS